VAADPDPTSDADDAASGMGQDATGGTTGGAGDSAPLPIITLVSVGVITAIFAPDPPVIIGFGTNSSPLYGSAPISISGGIISGTSSGLWLPSRGTLTFTAPMADFVPIVDTTAPALAAGLAHDTGRSAVDGLTNDATLSGTSETGATVTFVVGDRVLGGLEVAPDGNWSFTPFGLSQGAHTIDVTASDAAGNATVAQVGFTLDTVAPAAPRSLTLVIESTGVHYYSGALTSDRTPTFWCITDAGTTVKITEGDTALGSNTAPGIPTFNILYIDSSALSLGSHSLTFTATDVAGNAAAAEGPYPLTIAPVLGRDFDGRGREAMLFHGSDGAEWQWQTDGSTITNQGGDVVDKAWSIAGTGDFNGDGHADMLWHHTDGSTYIWEMNGTSIIGMGGPGVVDTAWSVLAVADFTGEGHADILWRHAGDDQLWLFQMNGTTNTGGGGIANLPGAPWSVVGAADLTGDGRADLIWQNTTSGEFYAWSMAGTTVLAQGTLGLGGGGTPGDWHLAGTGDFNHDGHADLLLRNAASGAMQLWEMAASALGHNALQVSNPGIAWVVQALGDYNGDGNTDILWRNSSTGEIYDWLMNGNAIIGQYSFDNPGAAWTLIA
jgi:hypothetical protein